MNLSTIKLCITKLSHLVYNLATYQDSNSEPLVKLKACHVLIDLRAQSILSSLLLIRR